MNEGFRTVFGKDVDLTKTPKEICESYPDRFHLAEGLDGKYYYLTTWPGNFVSQKFDLTPISNLEAYERFGLEAMDDATEKSYIVIDKK